MEQSELTHEHSKEFVLRSLDRVVGLEEGEADEETRGNVQDNLAHDINRIARVVLCANFRCKSDAGKNIDLRGKLELTGPRADSYSQLHTQAVLCQ
jgi:hypothetical protein